MLKYSKMLKDPLDKLFSKQKSSVQIAVVISLIGISLFLFLVTLAPFKDKLLSTLYPKPPSQAAGATIYVSPTGTASGDGSSNNPWDIRTGNSRMAEGDTLILKDGIYSIDTVNAGWLGLGPSGGTVRSYVKADTGARPIIIDSEGHAPNIYVNSFVHVEGLWFGTPTKDTVEYVFQHGNDVELVDNTFFNQYGAVNEGASTRNKYISNRFINTSSVNRYHSIYINNMMAKPGEGALLERNIYIGKPTNFEGGYATHLWHNPGYVTVRNNFYGDVCYGIVVQGKGNLVENDILWSSGGWQNVAMWLPTDNEYWAPPQDANNGKNVFTFRHNFLGPNNSNRLVSQMSSYDPAVVIDNNYFVNISTFGNNPKTLTLADVQSNLGVSGSQLDTTISNLESSFTGKTLQQIHDDTSIEGNFSTIKTAQTNWTAGGVIATLTPTPQGGGITPTILPTSTNIPTPTPTTIPSPTPIPGDTTLPTAPSNLTANSVSSSQINLSWTASTDNVAVAGYDIYRNNIKIASITSTSFGDTNLSASTTYSYFVKAVDSSGNISLPSNTATATTQPPPSSTGNITGTVNSSLESPISGASVSFTVGKSKKTYRTNSLGVYNITNLNPSSYTLKYSGAGYQAISITVQVTAGVTVTQNMTLIKSGKK